MLFYKLYLYFRQPFSTTLYQINIIHRGQLSSPNPVHLWFHHPVTNGMWRVWRVRAPLSVRALCMSAFWFSKITASMERPHGEQNSPFSGSFFMSRRAQKMIVQKRGLGHVSILASFEWLNRACLSEQLKKVLLRDSNLSNNFYTETCFKLQISHLWTFYWLKADEPFWGKEELGVCTHVCLIWISLAKHCKWAKFLIMNFCAITT